MFIYLFVYSFISTAPTFTLLTQYLFYTLMQFNWFPIPQNFQPLSFPSIYKYPIRHRLNSAKKTLSFLAYTNYFLFSIRFPSSSLLLSPFSSLHDSNDYCFFTFRIKQIKLFLSHITIAWYKRLLRLHNLIKCLRRQCLTNIILLSTRSIPPFLSLKFVTLNSTLSTATTLVSRLITANNSSLNTNLSRPWNLPRLHSQEENHPC